VIDYVYAVFPSTGADSAEKSYTPNSAGIITGVAAADALSLQGVADASLQLMLATGATADRPNTVPATALTGAFNRVPFLWAKTQNNLGGALARLGERESGTARLEEALVAHRAALEELTRDRVPLLWAVTQNNLGGALARLGERESGTARLEEAVDAYRAALEERTRDRAPLDWAVSTGNQGIALMLLAVRLGDATRAQMAIRTIEVAFEITRNGGYAPAAAHYEAALSKAQILFNRLTSH
jgi:tetratricopeptide (TPR) repeat protein